MPPPSETSSALSARLSSDEEGRQVPVRRTVSGEMARVDQSIPTLIPGELPAMSFVQELEPSDSERVTEVPPEFSGEDSEFAPETIPAPTWVGEEEQ